MSRIDSSPRPSSTRAMAPPPELNVQSIEDVASCTSSRGPDARLFILGVGGYEPVTPAAPSTTSQKMPLQSSRSGQRGRPPAVNDEGWGRLFHGVAGKGDALLVFWVGGGNREKQSVNLSEEPRASARARSREDLPGVVGRDSSEQWYMRVGVGDRTRASRPSYGTCS